VTRAAFAVPGSLDTPTGGFAYDKRIIEELRALGWWIDVVDLGVTFPHPDRAARQTALGRLLALPDGLPIVIDGLAFGAMAGEARSLCDRYPLVALVHHPLALETGIDAATAEMLRASERTALGCARTVIVTSEPTATIVVRDYAVPRGRVTVISPGVDRPAVLGQSRRHRDIVELLAVGAITSRKGHDLLIEALAGLKALPWRLTIAGDTTRSATALASLQDTIVKAQVKDRVVIAGAVSNEELAEFYADADVFVLASQFEGYGMVFGEAVAQGLPIVATAVGAAGEIVPPDAGILVAPDNVEALGDALQLVIEDADARERMAIASRQGAERLSTWHQSAQQFAATLERLAAGGSS
jgi:glycosyltransferase involved in cell wall biosynthesis